MNDTFDEESHIQIKTFDKRELINELYEKLQQLRLYTPYKDRVDALLQKIETTSFMDKDDFSTR